MTDRNGKHYSVDVVELATLAFSFKNKTILCNMLIHMFQNFRRMYYQIICIHEFQISSGTVLPIS